MLKIKEILIELHASFWFVPIVIVTLSITLAFVLIELDSRYSANFVNEWPRLFGAGADASRGMLSTIASSTMSMMTVAFSMTLVTLALASSQYTSRILRNFMRSYTTQIVLGIFAGVFTYCLIVLRTVRGGSETEFIPSIAIVVGFFLAVLAVAALVIFIHHIASSIQASSILSLIHEETTKTIKQLFPEKMGDGPEDNNKKITFTLTLTQSILSNKSGYIQSVSNQGLLDLSKKWKSVIRMNYGIGDFVIFGTPLVFISNNLNITDHINQELRELFSIKPYRTIEQDPLYGIRQMVDIALKALSPGINDTTTAVNCVDYLTATLSHLTIRKIPSSYHFVENELRVVAKVPSYEVFLDASFNQIITNAKGNIAVIKVLIKSIQVLTELTSNPIRRHFLALESKKISEVSNASLEFSYDKHEFKNQIGKVKDL